MYIKSLLNLLILTAFTIGLTGSSMAKSSTCTRVTIDDRTDPVWVVNQIFEAAKNQQYDVLNDLCDPMGENDKDTEMICTIANAPEDIRQSFIDHFSSGRVVGEAKIEGNTAKVNFKFGKNSDKDETMNLIKRDGEWYLSSF